MVTLYAHGSTALPSIRKNYDGDNAGWGARSGKSDAGRAPLNPFTSNHTLKETSNKPPGADMSVPTSWPKSSRTQPSMNTA